MINGFDFILPTKIRYGRGMISALGDELLLAGSKRIMIITDRGLVNTGLVDKLIEIIKDMKMNVFVFDDIEANPKDYNVKAGAQMAKDNLIDTIIAFGGGSPIDAAKGVAVLAKQGGEIKDYSGFGKISGNCLPLITIPTTSGTGSEVTFSSVITDTKSMYKFTIKSVHIAARTAIIDPELTISVPPMITASTGIDALTHAIEGYTAKCTEPIAEAMGLYAVEYIVNNIVKAVKNGNDIEARDNMMMGSLLAGLSFSHADVASVHCMAEALGSLYDAPHGMCNSILLPYVMEYNLSTTVSKYARIARVMGIKEEDNYNAAVKGIKRIKEISKEIGLPGIRSLNINPEEFSLLAEMSEKNGSNSSNPRKITKKEYLELFQKAYDDK